MTIYLVNLFFDHVIIGTNSNSTRLESDIFTYIKLEKYTSNKFYSIMIDKGASRQSTARYGQYFAYKKKIKHVQGDKSRAGAINVQFGIGSIFSIGSLLLGTPIEIIEFHVVEADTLFLLCLKDMISYTSNSTTLRTY